MVNRPLYLVTLAGAILVAAGLAVAVLYPSGRESEPRQQGTETVAVFEGGEITRAELQGQVDSFARGNGMEDPTPGSFEYDLALSQVMPYLVQLEVTEAHAAENGTTVTLGEIEQELGRKATGDDERSVESIRSWLILEKVREEVAGSYEPSGEEVEKEYEEVKGMLFTTPERRCARQITLGEDEAAVAESMKGELQRGGSFAELARRRSGDAEAGNSTCWERNGALPPEVEAALFGGREGEILGPIASDDDLHLLEVAQIRAAQTTPIEEAAPEIEEKIAQERRDEEFDEWVREQSEERDLEYLLPGYEPPA